MIENLTNKRIAYLDVLLVLATFMVIMVHVGDAYILNIETMTFGKEATFFAVLLRSSAPLFIIMSLILLLPIKTGSIVFFKRRFSWVVIPFLVWSIIYIFLPLPNIVIFGGTDNVLAGSDMNIFLYNLIMIPFNFTASNVHFWFIYIILGLYLFMPIFSPWIKNASKKAFVFFLGIWIITLFFPYIRMFFPRIHGESDWNDFGMMYYFGGYFGYVILGYFSHHYTLLSVNKFLLLETFLFLVGAALTYWGFIHDQNVFLNKIATSNEEDWKLIEFNMNFLSPNIVIMTTGIFLIVQEIKV